MERSKLQACKGMKRWIRGFVCIFLLAMCPSVWANSKLENLEAFRVQDGWSGQYLGRYFYMKDYEDRGTTAQTALSEILDKLPERNPTSRPNFGVSLHSHFALFVVENPGTEPIEVIFENNFGIGDYFFLHAVTPPGDTREILRAGDQEPIYLRSVISRVMNKQWTLNPGRNYFMAQTYGDTCAQLPIRIWKPGDFHENLGQDYLIIGILIGFHLVMIFYNLFLFFTIKDRIYLYYVLFVAANTVFHVSNLNLGQYIGWEVFGTAIYVNPIQLYSVDLIIITSILFTRRYFGEVYKRWPWIEPLIRMNIALSLYNMTVNQAISHNLTSIFTLVGSSICISIFILVGLLALRSGYKPARYYLLGWTGYLIGSSEAVAVFMGWVEVNDFNYWAQIYGGAMEVAMFSVALGMRLKFIQNQQSLAIQNLNYELRELNQNLEGQVEERTRDIKMILTNLQQGIFVIQKDQRIDGEYSPFLERLFETRELAGKPLLPLLRSTSDLSEDKLDTLTSALDLSLGEEPLAFQLNEGNLPRTFTLKHQSNQRRMIDADWVAVEAGGVTDRILVSLRDVTESRKMQETLARRDNELRMISELLEVRPDKFNRFLDVSKQVLHENASLLAQGDWNSDDSLRRQLINYHTLKGMARTLGFLDLSNHVHQAESALVEIRLGQKTADLDKLRSDVIQIEGLIAQYTRINNERLGRESSSNSILVQKEVVIQLVAEIERLGVNASTMLGEHANYLKGIYYRSLEDIVYDQINSLKELSQNLGKAFPRIVFEGLSYGLHPRMAEVFEAAFMHLIRNSLDHGIETPAERRNRDKPERGTINLFPEQRLGLLVLTYRDDGAGLDLARIRSRAQELGLRPEGEGTKELASLIFHSGFSTKQQITQISGRGVGLDAVRSLLRKVEAGIELKLLKKLPHAAEAYAFEFVITFPAHSFMELTIEDEKRSLAV